MPEIKYFTGCVASKPDPRDQIYAMSVTSADTPKSFMLTMPRAKDQGNEGTCCAHALVTMMDYMRSNFPNNDDRQVRSANLSIRDAYESGRAMGLYSGEGMSPRDAFKNANQNGICHELDWVYIPRFKGDPTIHARANRMRNYIGTYHAVPKTVQDIKNALLQTRAPLLFTSMTSGIDGFSPNARSIVSLKNNNGNHAMVITGYDDQQRLFRIQNSWGTGWGADGNAFFSYDQVDLIGEIWAAAPEFYGQPRAKNNNWWEPIVKPMFKMFGWN